MRAARRGGGARTGAAAASLALHGVLLAWLAASVLPRASPRPEPPPRADVQLELERPPAPPDPRPAALSATTAPSAARDLAPAAARSRPAPPSQVQATPAPPSPAAPLQAPPAPPAPARGPAAGGSAASPRGPAAAGGAPARGAGAEANVGGFLRATVGCSHEGYMRLSAAERARCDAGYASAKGAPLPLETDKLAAYSREALRNEAKRARGEGPLRGGFVPCDTAMVGSNLSPGCLPADAYTSVRR